MRKILALIVLTTFSCIAMAQKTKSKTKTTKEETTSSVQTEKKEITRSSVFIEGQEPALRQGANTLQEYYDSMDAEKMASYKLNDKQQFELKTINSEYGLSISKLNKTEAPSRWVDSVRNVFQNQRTNKYLNLLSNEDRPLYQSYLSSRSSFYLSPVNKLDISYSGEQLQQFNEIDEGFMEKEIMLINNNSLEKEERNRQLLEINIAKIEAYKKVLTSEQIEKLKPGNNKIKIETTNGEETKKVKIETKKSGEIKKIKEKTKSKAPAKKAVSKKG